jgi:hypothetical protein
LTKQFVVSLENKPGTLSEITNALGKAGVNISSFSLTSQGEFGTFRFCTNNDPAVENWLKSTGHRFRTNEIVIVKTPNRAGEIGRITNQLAQSGVNIEACYGVAGQTPGDEWIAIQPSPEHFMTTKKILGIQ